MGSGIIRGINALGRLWSDVRTQALYVEEQSHAHEGVVLVGLPPLELSRFDLMGEPIPTYVYGI